jgi:uncharacterized membrane protein
MPHGANRETIMNNRSVTFDIAQLFKDSWELFKRNMSPLLGGYLIAMVIISVSGAVYIGPLILSGPLVLGLFKMSRMAVRGESIEFSELFSGFQRFLDAFLANLIITIFTIAGSILCIIPGLLVGIAYMSTYLFMLDDKLAFWDAMEASRKMVMNNPVQWIILWLVLCLFNIVGVLACCAGLILTGPISLLVLTLAYDAERRAVIEVVAVPVEPSA